MLYIMHLEGEKNASVKIGTLWRDVNKVGWCFVSLSEYDQLKTWYAVDTNQ